MPAKAMANDGEFRPSVIETRKDGDHLIAGRGRAGGMWLRLLCEPCNNRAGFYDEELTRFWATMIRCRSELQGDGPGGVVGLAMTTRPGSVIRSVLAGMFALNPRLLQCHPTIAHAIRFGTPVVAPSGFRVLLGLHMGTKASIAGGPLTSVSYDLRTRTSVSRCTSGEWWWPPLHLVLTDDDGFRELRSHMPIESWLGDDPRSVRSVALLVPKVAPDHLLGVSA